MIKGRHLYIYIYIRICALPSGGPRGRNNVYTSPLSLSYSLPLPPPPPRWSKQNICAYRGGNDDSLRPAKTRLSSWEGEIRSDTFPSNLLPYSPSSQIPVHEVQILQVPHARRDLGRHVDETVETETREQRRESREGKVKGREIAQAFGFADGRDEAIGGEGGFVENRRWNARGGGRRRGVTVAHD